MPHRIRSFIAKVQVAFERAALRVAVTAFMVPAAAILGRLGQVEAASFLRSSLDVLRSRNWDLRSVRPGCEWCWHGVYAGDQGAVPCRRCAPHDWANLRLVMANEHRLMESDLAVTSGYRSAEEQREAWLRYEQQRGT